MNAELLINMLVPLNLSADVSKVETTPPSVPELLMKFLFIEYKYSVATYGDGAAIIC